MPPQQVLSEMRRPVKVFLSDIRLRETIPNRTLFLLPPTYETTIGRGSQAEPNLHPQEWNAWFGSRVMSREHAYLRADPQTKQIFLEDAGSMHGTYVGNLRVDQARAISEDDTVQLGTEIVRGDQTYKPLVLSVRAEFFDNVDQSQSRSPAGSSRLPKNTFTVDYSEEEDEDDVEVVYEALHVPSSELDRQSRTFSVPDSDLSDSDAEECTNKESAPSSPEERPEKLPQPIVLTHPDVVVTITTEDGVDPTAVLPGSCLQNALDVSDDEDQEANKDREFISEEIDAASIYSEENHDSTDEDVVSNDMSEPDDESYTDMYDGDDAQDEQSVDDMNHQESHMSQDLAHNETGPRSPSPSDCALPKPSWYAPNHLPAIQSLQAPTQSIIFPDTFPVGSAHLSPFQPYGCYSGMSWQSNDNSSGFTGTFDQGYNATSLVTYQHGMPQASRSCTRALPDRVIQVPQPIENRYAPANDDNSTKPSKVSINDIIDDVNFSSANTGGNRKRKADEISTTATAGHSPESCELQSKSPEPSASDANVEPVLLPSTDSNTLQLTPEIQTPNETVTESPPSCKKSVSFSAVPVVIESDSDRPRKKAKTHSENGGSNILKYVAAAVGGVTIGAVGTVFGLAALPSDYFL